MAGNFVVGRSYVHPRHVAKVDLPGRVRTDEVARNEVSAIVFNKQTDAPAIDDQTAHNIVAGVDEQADTEGGPASVQLDEQHRVVAGSQGVRAGARLRVAIDGDRARDRGQRAKRPGGLDPRAGKDRKSVV